MSQPIIVDQPGETKANMDAIYGEADPRAYFRELGKLDYRIPELAKPIFERIVGLLRRERPAPIHALDLGCSYGINGALLKHGRSIEELGNHWSRPEIAAADSAEVIAADRDYFDPARADDDLVLLGLDVSRPAIDYAEQAGLIDKGLAINLETQALPGDARSLLEPVDLVMSTGAVGYVTEATFERLLPAVTTSNPPWISNFVLRMFPFDAIDETLSRWGYVTEKLEGHSFIQRSFASGEEEQRILAELESMGLDPTGLEAEGNLHAEFFLSRPRAQAGLTVNELLAA